MPAEAAARCRLCPLPNNRCAARRRDPARTPDFPRWRGDRRRRTRRTGCSRTPPLPGRRPAALAASAGSALAPDQPRDLGALLGVVVELERFAPPDGGLDAISLLGLRVAHHLAGAGAVPPAQHGLLEDVLEDRLGAGRTIGPEGLLGPVEVLRPRTRCVLQELARTRRLGLLAGGALRSLAQTGGRYRGGRSPAGSAWRARGESGATLPPSLRSPAGGRRGAGREGCRRRTDRCVRRPRRRTPARGRCTPRWRWEAARPREVRRARAGGWSP